MILFIILPAQTYSNHQSLTKKTDVLFLLNYHIFLDHDHFFKHKLKIIISF